MHKIVDQSEISAEILEAIRRAPLISVSASRLLEITGHSEHNLSDVANVVQHDAILTGQVLKIVNSAAFALLQPVTSIARAISFLGEKLLVGIAIGQATSQIFDKALVGYGGERGDLWRHDLCTAIASAEIAKLNEENLSVDLAFTGGILHDIGKALISDFLKNTAEGVLSHIESGVCADYVEAEQQLLGVDHSIVGFELAKLWNLPEPLLNVIQYHHQPASAEEGVRPLVYAIHLGDIIAMMCGRGTGADTMQYHLDSKYRDYIDFSSDDVALIMMKVEEEYKKIEASFTE